MTPTHLIAYIYGISVNGLACEAEIFYSITGEAKIIFTNQSGKREIISLPEGPWLIIGIRLGEEESKGICFKHPTMELWGVVINKPFKGCESFHEKAVVALSELLTSKGMEWDTTLILEKT